MLNGYSNFIKPCSMLVKYYYIMHDKITGHNNIDKSKDYSTHDNIVPCIYPSKVCGPYKVEAASYLCAWYSS